MSYGRMKKVKPELAAEVERWFAQAALDEQEDAENGVDRRGDELPDWVTDKKKRLEKIRQAKAELEAEARAVAEVKKSSAPPERQEKKDDQANSEVTAPADKAQKNFTDPESRIMKTGDGFIQGYNAQAAVDADSQVTLPKP